MYLGNMVELTTSKELYAEPLHPYTQALLSAIPVPDPEAERGKERIKLEGEVPSPINPKPGCKFATRCRFAKPECKDKTPELIEVKPGHFVACHLVKY